ncbi:MAG: hypothetical protein RLY43_405 [Bacteroidota bacterium]|jgi:hypothetical protein
MSLPHNHPAVWRALESYYPTEATTTWSVVPCTYNNLIKDWGCKFVGGVVEFDNPATETAFLLKYS